MKKSLFIFWASVTSVVPLQLEGSRMVRRVHLYNVGGKSGQHRANRFLMGSCL